MSKKRGPIFIGSPLFALAFVSATTLRIAHHPVPLAIGYAGLALAAIFAVIAWRDNRKDKQ